jgi:hypothetical protein
VLGNNDTSNGHYLYYYRSTLDVTDPAHDLAARIQWAARYYQTDANTGAAAAGADANTGAGAGADADADAGVGAGAVMGDPVFLLVFGGLGLYGGHDDFFLFLQRVVAELGDQYVVVGATEITRLARAAAGLE